MLIRLLLPILLLCASCVFPYQRGSIDKQKIRSVFESLLELDSDENGETGGEMPLRATDYMKNLYEEAAEAGMKGTVRTVAPRIESMEGVDVLVFPLSHLKIGHRLIRAELHMLGRRPDKLGRALRVEGVVGKSVHETILMELSSVSSDAALWNAVQPILYNFANSTNLVLKLSRWDGYRMRPLPVFVSRHSPFLTVYTRSEDEEGAMKKDSARRSKRSIQPDNYFAYESEDSNVLQKGRAEFAQRGPAILNTRVKNTKFTRRRYEKMKAKQPFWGFGEKEVTEVSSRILKIGNEDEEKEQIGERTLEMTTAVNEGGDVDVVLLQPEQKKNTVCSVHELTVDFEEIGWSDMVLAPSTFNAGFCGGDCPFPLPLEARASNHAILQSAISSSQSSGLPPVCCAPDKMDSLTLLYRDPKGRMTIKSYPRMVVQSCGCV